MKTHLLTVVLLFNLARAPAQYAVSARLPDSTLQRVAPIGQPQLRSFAATAALLDAALNSLNSLQSSVSKDNYRNRINALNNPASSELGFSLEGEIQAALQPILAKTRSVSSNRFSNVVGALLQGQKNGGIPLMPALGALVGNLAVQEKRVSREDLDSFLLRTARCFAPYEKLQQANDRFELEVTRLGGRLTELQFDIREYALDMVTLLHPGESRATLRQKTIEELLLQYLDGPVLDRLDTTRRLPAYPLDGVKGAKEICNEVQKLFREYQKVYGDNYAEIRSIVQSARGLGRAGNVVSVDATLRELEVLYAESAQADVLNLRLSTLAGRLQALVLSVQQPVR
ncbi:MAG: hypothetical protein EOO15_13520 [Chitinophagaceae bacterium]|nr:MAG: hypothetical protein EOO15_13520 [Chitinophagaceae bacterium]